jgi:conjugal transfer pilus assembly protein TraF
MIRPIALALITALSVSLPSYAFQTPAGEVGQWWDDTPWNDPDRGFNWYPDPKEEAKPEAKPKPELKKKTIEEMTDLKEIQDEIQRLKSLAVANPTEKTVLDFLRAQNLMMNKAAKFADVSRRVVWANPEVNYAARAPYANFASQNQRERRSKDERATVAALSETHAILFFTRSDCPFCQDQAPVLKAFSNQSGMPVLAVSLDNKPVSHFPDAKPDNGISLMASGGEGIKTVPAMFLLDRQSKQMIPIGSGIVTGTELSDRIHILTKTSPGQEF